MKANGKIRAGIIGIGNWERYGHVPVLQLLPEFEIVAVASRRQEAAEQRGSLILPTLSLKPTN